MCLEERPKIGEKLQRDIQRKQEDLEENCHNGNSCIPSLNWHIAIALLETAYWKPLILLPKEAHMNI